MRLNVPAVRINERAVPEKEQRASWSGSGYGVEIDLGGRVLGTGESFGLRVLDGRAEASAPARDGGHSAAAVDESDGS